MLGHAGSRHETSYDVLLNEFVPATIDRRADKAAQELYNVVMDARVMHVGRSGDTVDKPVPIESLRPLPRGWAQAAAANGVEPECFAATGPAGR